MTTESQTVASTVDLNISMVDARLMEKNATTVEKEITLKVCRFDRNEDKRSQKVNRRRQQRKPNQVEELDRSFESDFESNNYIIKTIEKPGSQEINVKAKFKSNFLT